MCEFAVCNSGHPFKKCQWVLYLYTTSVGVENEGGDGCEMKENSS